MFIINLPMTGAKQCSLCKYAKINHCLSLQRYIGKISRYCLDKYGSMQCSIEMPFIPSYVHRVHTRHANVRQPRWLSGQRRSHVHSLMIARRSLCPEKLGSNPGPGSKGINFSGWHGLDMSITVTKRR